ncbi:hypothetical protein ENBRE01_0611 [Enteropsectra breve]|nr:hypothetical protein ENBRE01_0611 [Enteropsectra breve]
MKKLANFHRFAKSLQRLSASYRILAIILLPIFILMVLSNITEEKSVFHSSTLCTKIRNKEDANFNETLQKIVIYTVSHYLLGFLYRLIFFSQLGFISTNLQLNYIEYCIRAKYSEYQHIGTGKISSIIRNQSESILALLEIVVIDLGYHAVYFIICLKNIWQGFNGTFAAVFLFLFIVLFIYTVISIIVMSRARSAINILKYRAITKMYDITKNLSIIRSFNNETHELGAYKKKLMPLEWAEFAHNTLAECIPFIYRNILFFTQYTIVLCTYYGLYGFKVQDVTRIILFIDTFKNFKSRLMKFKDMCFAITRCYSDILHSELELSAATDSQHSMEIQQASDICFKEVAIKHEENLLFEGLNLSIANGEKLAITGRNGAGKSTIIKALMGFIDYDGAIEIGGEQISNVNGKALRDLISYVPQEPHLMNTTVWENLIYGNKGKSHEEIIDLCKRCNIHEIFMGLPNGYNTHVGENGRFLSGGQCQLLNFMRAVVKDAPIFVLDEPTSNLDYRASKELLDLIFHVLKEKTVLYSTHNPTDLKRFDRFINIKNKHIDVYNSMREFSRACGGELNL